ncbi:MAG: TRAP transporter small permease [Ottowia sp.]|uniref:TRAP transporter small permease n=1 Tax=Ottowia sp. TaxID=1898956 RepID=UPI003C715E54
MEKIIWKLEQCGLALAAASIGIVMVLVSMDAIFRYAFNAPMQWIGEVVSYYLLIGAGYFAVSATYREGDHINIDLLQQKMPAKMRAVVDGVCSALVAIVFGLIAWLALEHAIEAFQNNEYKPGYITWPVWLSLAPIPLGAAVLCARLVHHIVTLARLGHDPYLQTAHHGESFE